MKTGPIVTAVVSFIAIGGVMFAFGRNASPYVTIAQAIESKGDHVHLAGDVIPNTVRIDMVAHTLSFDLKDSEGRKVHVVHHGDLPANIAEVKRVVAVGGIKGTDFVSEKLNIKCPSKYEEGKGDYGKKA